MKELSPGDTINTRYVIESVLGVGGMGVVYAAVQLPLSRRVALKIMGTPGSGNYTPQQFELAKKRFYREASLCAKLRHPNVLTVYDYGEVDSGPCAGSYFLATEYLSGQTLDARMLPGKGMPVSEVVATVIEIVRGLREAHRHGLVHRDLKPENVMLVPSDDGKDRVVILDFGLVRELDNDPSLQATQDNMICGTPRYIAPEQLAKKGPDPRSDLYSVGLIMYEALTGEYPYNTTNIFALLHSHVHQTVPKLREKEATRGVSGELEKLVAKLLEKDPEGRYQSAYDLLVDLRALPESAPTLSGILPKNSSTAQQAIILSTASQFQLGTKIAGTNNSIVYEATHIECGRKVVVKLRVPASPEEEARIIKTLPTLSMLRHPANVRVFDIGLAKSGAMTVPFLVMEYLRGESLSDRLLRKGKFTTAQVFSIGLQLTQALGEAHTFGLIHGNLDPDHIKTVEAAGEEVVKVHGYPMAPAVEKSLMSLIPLSTNISHYVAPEIISGGRAREASDVYALGQILRTCLGHGRAITAQEPEDDLHAVINRATAQRVADRYESMRAFHQALKSVDIQQVLQSTAHSTRISSEDVLSASLNIDVVHQVWVLGGDPAVDGPVVEMALSALPNVNMVPVASGRHISLMQLIERGRLAPPSVVLFGLSHKDSAEEFLASIRGFLGTKRVLVTTSTEVDHIFKVVNLVGIDKVVMLPEHPREITSKIQGLIDSTDTASLRYVSPFKTPWAASTNNSRESLSPCTPNPPQHHPPN